MSEARALKLLSGTQGNILHQTFEFVQCTDNH